MDESADARPEPALSASVADAAGLWGPVARAAIYGFLFGGGILLALPWAPYLGLALVGVEVALLSRDAGLYWAVGTGAMLGVLLFWLAALARPGLLEQPLALLGLLSVPAGVLVGRALLLAVSLRWLVGVLLVVLCALFLIQGFRAVPSVDRRIGGEPRAESYDYDPFFFVRIFYLVEDHGEGFYQAYGRASREDARFERPIDNLAGWRTPALTWLWTTFLRSSHDIVVAYLVIATLAMVLGFLTAARLSDPATALTVPALLLAYNLAQLETLHFLAYEVWAGFFAMAAATLVAYRLDWAAVVPAVGAASIREWFVSALVGGIADAVARRRWWVTAVWSLALIAVLGFYVVSLGRAREYLLSEGVTPSSGTSGRLGQGGPLFVLYTLQFGARLYLQVYVVPYLVFFLGLLGSAALIRRRELYVPALVLLPVLLFLITGSGRRPGDPYGMDVYYGGAFLPFAMVAACCAGQLFGRVRTRGVAVGAAADPGVTP